MNNELVFDQPIETGPIRAEFYGDTEKAKGHITAGRKILGAVRNFYGVNQRMAEGEAGGFYRHLSQLEDGTQIEVLTNNGMDTVRIYAVPETAPEVERKINPILPEEELPIVPVYDEGSVEYILWIVFSSTVNYDITLKKWSFTNGFAGTEITLPSIKNGHTALALAMYDGWVWGVYIAANGIYSDSIFRKNILTGEKQELHNHISQSPEGGRTAASTVTPLGVLFAVGRVSASFILIGPDGNVLYSVANNTRIDSGWFGDRMTSFINDGAHAFLHYTDGGGAPRGLVIVEIATGISTTINLSAQYFDTPDDYRLGAGAFAALSGNSMYGVRFRSNDGPPYEPTEVFVRSPSNSVGSSTLLDVSSYFPEPDGFSNLKYMKGGASRTDDGMVVVTTAKDLVVIDPTTNATTSYSVAGLWGFVFGDSWNNGKFPEVNKGASVLPDSNLIALHFLPGILPYGTAPAALATLNVATGAAATYELPDSRGYLTQITINAASNPDPTLPPLKEEWEYLSATNVNPI